jgi:hypothetical protein
METFLPSLIHRTIALAEEEQRTKEQTKVWRGRVNEVSLIILLLCYLSTFFSDNSVSRVESRTFDGRCSK